MKLRNILLFAATVLASASCSFLEFDETNGLKDKEDIYRYFNHTQQMLNHIYSFMPQDLGAVGGAMRDCASDDAEFGNVAGGIQVMNNGNWSPVRNVDNAWNLYKAVRAANMFIEDIQNVDFSRFEHDGSYANDMKKLACFPYEARVLRAQYFFELARRYGDIAMPLTVLTPDEANTIGKTSFQQVIEFIVKECDECAEKLPETHLTMPNAEVGRITKGYAMALKSKVLLYASSPLHNVKGDKELCKRSAQAALDLINTGLYQLDPAETANNVASKEVVLHRLNAENSYFERQNFPIRFTEGSRTSDISSSTFPSQNLVDAFETINGYKVTLGANGWICDDPEFDENNPYENRDPRFYRAILANGMVFKDDVIETFEGGKDNVGVAQGGSPTGYFLMKYIQSSTSFKPDNLVKNKHHWVIYRYAETLLTYAESMLNAFGDPDYTDATFTKSARWALNAVRANAGMPAVVAKDPEEFRTKLYNEWRVEFAFEDHRFWDIRRWKIASSIPQELDGVKIEILDGKQHYSRYTYEVRTWKECMYLFPIPQKELFNNQNLAPQNPGW